MCAEFEIIYLPVKKAAAQCEGDKNISKYLLIYRVRSRLYFLGSSASAF